MQTLITVQEAAKLCRTTPRTIYRWADHKSQFKRQDFIDKCVVRPGRKVLIKLENFQEWLRRDEL